MSRHRITHWHAQVMFGLGVLLCAAAIILTVIARPQLTSAAPAAGAPKGYTPTPPDFALEVVTVGKECFGSAGCLVTFRIEVTYLAAFPPDSARNFTAVYDIHGGAEPLIDRFSINRYQVSTSGEHIIETSSPDAVLTAMVTRVL